MAEQDELELEQDSTEAPTLTFDMDLVRKYPRANKRLGLVVERFGIREELSVEPNGQSQFISPHGLEFKTTEEFPDGALLKIHVSMPNYWGRKQRFVEYARIDTPETFRILAKVVRQEEVGKRGKKKVVTCQTLVMDEIDEQVLKTFLQEG